MVTKIDYKRQSIIFDPNETQGSVTIIGLGNTGSHVALTLARLGVKNLVLYDYDKVENHNLSSQAYSVGNIGCYKAEALKNRILELNPSINVLAFNEKVTKDTQIIPGDICIIGVDTMKERRKIHGYFASQGNIPNFFIDAGMGGGQLEIYVCSSMKEWESTFVRHPSEDPCGGRFICYVSCIIGGFIANKVKKILKGQKYKKTVIINVDTLEILTSDDLT